MAGHSRFKKIKHKKAANDGKKSQNNARYAREITIAARLGGGDPTTNSRLRTAIISAKQANYAKSKIEAAIKKGVNPNEGEALEEVRFEGFGPRGIAIMVEAVTTSKQICIDKSQVKKTFSKNGGTMGELGCVSYLFQRLGLITYPASVKPEDDMMMLALDHGADDCQKVDDEYEILCSFDSLHSVVVELEKAIGEPSFAKLIWKPNNTVSLDPIKTKAVVTLLDLLNDLECVQDVWTNLEIPDD